MLKISVITISDRAYSGAYPDLSGPIIRAIIDKGPEEYQVKLTVVPDEKNKISRAILDNLNNDYIVTTGGTGISPRDITPEITAEICDKEIPGIAEMLRFESYRQTRNAVFSRGYCGLKGKTIIINLPGSVKAVTQCTKLLLPLLNHGKKMILGGKH